MRNFHLVFVVLMFTNAITSAECSDRFYDFLRHSSSSVVYSLPETLDFPNATKNREILSFVSNLKANYGNAVNSSGVQGEGYRLSETATKKRTRTSPAEESLTVVNSSSERWVEVTVNHSNVMEKFDHFWESTGFCPPAPHDKFHEFLSSLDAQTNLELIGSLPHDAIKQVRVHWLMDLVNASLVRGRPEYDFWHLDRLLDQLYRLRLRPAFEVMGNPGEVFDDFENSTQVLWWRDLIKQLAQRYVDRYGAPWLTSWRWETWNEPDHRDFDGLNFTTRGFLNYFDATREGLDLVEPKLLLGGPGGSCREPNFVTFCYALLQHCQNGTSFFGGKKPRIDFLSFHKKGEEDADSITTGEESTIVRLQRLFPFLGTVPVINDESDFLKGWWRPRTWRADARYAALVVRAVASHHRARKTKPAFAHYELLSFDNAFLNYHPSYFDQRTLVTRFQINNTSPSQVQVVQKPAYAVATLLSKAGDRVTFSRVGTDDPRLSVMSSCRNCASQRRTRGGKQRRIKQKSGTTNRDVKGINKSIIDRAGVKVEDYSKTQFSWKKNNAYYEIKDGLINTTGMDNFNDGENPQRIDGTNEITFVSTDAEGRGNRLPLRRDGTNKKGLRTRRRGVAKENVYFDYRDSFVIPKRNKEMASDTRKNRIVSKGVGRKRKGHLLRKSMKFTFTEENADLKKKAWESTLILSFANNNQTEADIISGQETAIKMGTKVKQGMNEVATEEPRRGSKMTTKSSGEETEVIDEETVMETRQKSNRLLIKKHLKTTGGRQRTQNKRRRKERTIRKKADGMEKKNEETLTVILKVTFPPYLWGKTLYACHRSLGEKPGPYEVWRRQGSPTQPSPEQLRQLRAVQGSAGGAPFPLVAGPEPLRMVLRLRLSTVHLLHMCLPFSSQPGQVRHLRALKVTSTDVLLSWSDEEIPTRCVLSYQVEKSDLGKAGPYQVINDGALLLENNFLYSVPSDQGQTTRREPQDCEDNSKRDLNVDSRNHYGNNKDTKNSHNGNCSSECFSNRNNTDKGADTKNRATKTFRNINKANTSFCDCGRSCSLFRKRFLTNKTNPKSKTVTKKLSSARHSSKSLHKNNSSRKPPRSSRKSTRRRTTCRSGGDVSGWYRVRVVTYWKSFGSYSEPLYYAGH